MKAVVTRTIAGVLAGLILYFITERYLVNNTKQEESIDKPAENILPQDVQEPVEQLPPAMDEKPPDDPQVIQRVPEFDELHPQGGPEPKSAEETRTIENRSATPVVTPQPKTVEQEADLMSKDAHSKRDSLAKDKKLNQEVKKVNKRAEDVFDELEQEVGQDTIPNRLRL